MTDSTAAPKDARALLYDLVLACRAYDSTKPAHVQEYSFALDQAEAFLHTPRSEIAPIDIDWLANVIRTNSGDHLNPIGAGVLAERIVDALKKAAPQVRASGQPDTSAKTSGSSPAESAPSARCVD